MKEKGLLYPTDAMIDPSFTKEILEHPSIEQFKLSAIHMYDGTRDPIDHMWAFQLYMHYLDAFDAIICWVFPTTFRLVA